MRRLFATLTVSVVILLPSSFLSGQEGSFQLRVEDETVSVEGAVPGALVEIFSVEKNYIGFERRTDRRNFATNGGDTISVNDGISPKSLWIAVDHTSGSWAIATPGDYPIRTLPDTKGGPDKPDNRGTVARITARTRVTDVIVVRPGVGSWRSMLADGGIGDSDRKADGTAVFQVRDLVPVAEGSPDIQNLRKGDVVVLVDLNEMAIRVVTL